MTEDNITDKDLEALFEEYRHLHTSIEQLRQRMIACSDVTVDVVTELEDLGLSPASIANRLDRQRQTISNIIGVRNARPEPVSRPGGVRPPKP